MKWININEQLPPDNNKFGGKTYLVTVTCDTWEESVTMVMDWETKKVKSKDIKQWRWLSKIKPISWEVTHWMELPKPAILE